MKILTEVEAENFLENEGFNVVQRANIKTKTGLRKVLKEIGFPVVLKASGSNLIHKNKVKGVRVGINNSFNAESEFESLMRIRGCDEVVVQKQISGDEFLLGIKKTPDFGHVIAFGAGGIKTEELKDVSFRIAPFDKNDSEELINEVKFSEKLSGESKDIVLSYLLKLVNLVKKYPNIVELDVNPLMIRKNDAFVVDARIGFED